MLALNKKKDNAEILQEAFRRFDEASFKLQQKYEVLLRETEELRSELIVKEQALKRSEKLALLGETAAALAHEVRNPLGSIKLFMSLLRRDLDGNQSALEMVENVDRSVQALDNVVGNILRFSKKEKIEVAAMNLHSIIQEQVSYCRLSAGETLTFDLDLRANPFMQGNEQSLRQVFCNLMINAAQAMKNKGLIRVCTRDTESGLEISIQDNGPGIDSAIRERIFDPFVTNKNEGTGLGLAVVSQIVALHGGTITAGDEPSPPQSGAKFTIYLPRTGQQFTQGENR